MVKKHVKHLVAALLAAVMIVSVPAMSMVSKAGVIGGPTAGTDSVYNWEKADSLMLGFKLDKGVTSEAALAMAKEKLTDTTKEYAVAFAGDRTGYYMAVYNGGSWDIPDVPYTYNEVVGLIVYNDVEVYVIGEVIHETDLSDYLNEVTTDTSEIIPLDCVNADTAKMYANTYLTSAPMNAELVFAESADGYSVIVNDGTVWNEEYTDVTFDSLISNVNSGYDVYVLGEALGLGPAPVDCPFVKCDSFVTGFTGLDKDITVDTVISLAKGFFPIDMGEVVVIYSAVGDNYKVIYREGNNWFEDDELIPLEVINSTMSSGTIFYVLGTPVYYEKTGAPFVHCDTDKLLKNLVVADGYTAEDAIKYVSVEDDEPYEGDVAIYSAVSTGYKAVWYKEGDWLECPTVLTIDDLNRATLMEAYVYVFGTPEYKDFSEDTFSYCDSILVDLDVVTGFSATDAFYCAIVFAECEYAQGDIVVYAADSNGYKAVWWQEESFVECPTVLTIDDLNKAMASEQIVCVLGTPEYREFDSNDIIRCTALTSDIIPVANLSGYMATKIAEEYGDSTADGIIYAVVDGKCQMLVNDGKGWYPSSSYPTVEDIIVDIIENNSYFCVIGDTKTREFNLNSCTSNMIDLTVDSGYTSDMASAIGDVAIAGDDNVFIIYAYDEEGYWVVIRYDGIWHAADEALSEEDIYTIIENDVDIFVLGKVFEAKAGWNYFDGAWYLCDTDLNKLTGWQQSGTSWYYLDPTTGAMKTGWQYIGGLWYYLDASGAMKTGWIQSGKDWYYLKPSGAMATGWTQVGSSWYYLKSSGAMATGWLQIGSDWYYLKSSGEMVTGWTQIGSSWYYFKSSGAMATGWLQLGSSWYYLNSNGAMATGWTKVGSSWYYFYSSGVMAANTTIGGYKINASGVWVA